MVWDQNKIQLRFQPVACDSDGLFLHHHSRCLHERVTSIHANGQEYVQYPKYTDWSSHLRAYLLFHTFLNSHECVHIVHLRVVGSKVDHGHKLLLNRVCLRLVPEHSS